MTRRDFFGLLCGAAGAAVATRPAPAVATVGGRTLTYNRVPLTLSGAWGVAACPEADYLRWVVRSRARGG